MKILLLSDIHLAASGLPEQQGQILKAFWDDLNAQLLDTEYNSTFCIISGDLVNDGSIASYTFFAQEVINKLLKFMPLDNIFFVPGNHDLFRNIISKKESQSLIDSILKEEDFNDLCDKDESSILTKKFKHLISFVTDKLNIPQFDIWGYSANLTPLISAFFLNSSICSFGGLDDIDDRDHLLVNTRKLNEWIQSTEGRKRVLVMHHPIDDLSEQYRNELTRIIQKDIDIFINGHTHFINVEEKNVGREIPQISFQSPQLFSTKNANNGYAIITITENYIHDICFRQWTNRRKTFSTGIDYADDGVFKPKFQPNSPTKDTIYEKLYDRWNDAMYSFSKRPEWIERYFDENPPSKQAKNTNTLDYMDILSHSGNIQICASAQFGMSSFALYLSLKAWEIKNEHWLYINAENLTLGTLERLCKAELRFHEIDGQPHCVIFDKWPYFSKDSDKILKKIYSLYPEAKILLMTSNTDSQIVSGLDTEESHEGYKTLYMRPLLRKEMRQIVHNVNETYNIDAEDDKLLSRMVSDLDDLNIHRTPYNCFQMLLAFSKNYEERPINRSKVLDNVLMLVFDNPGSLYYQANTVDPETCKFIVGYFCEHLFKKGNMVDYSFTEEEFITVCKNFCKQQMNSTNVENLLKILLNHQIIVQNFGETLHFRFIYWLFYFAADRMKCSEDFKKYMIENCHILYESEMIDFYSATDRTRSDIAELLCQELINVSSEVHVNIGIPDDYSPYLSLKWAMNETSKGITVDALETQVMQSRLPVEIKDAIADKNYDSIRPYHQTIDRFFEEYAVKNLISITHSAACALRNSDFISPESKTNLANAIFYAWKEISRVIFAITPLLAKNGYGGIGGMRFTLTDGFPDEFKECVKTIIINVPYNIILWFKDDIYNHKTAELYYRYMLDSGDAFISHLMAMLIVECRPDGFKNELEKYVIKQPKNSYYLGNLFNNLRRVYSTGYMTKTELNQTKQLITDCWKKRQHLPENLIPYRDEKNID